MAYTPYGWQNPYYAQPMPDNLAQLRQQQKKGRKVCKKDAVQIEPRLSTCSIDFVLQFSVSRAP
jgi:hypothetical protein